MHSTLEMINAVDDLVVHMKRDYAMVSDTSNVVRKECQKLMAVAKTKHIM